MKYFEESLSLASRPQAGVLGHGSILACTQTRMTSVHGLTVHGRDPVPTLAHVCDAPP